MMMATHIPTGIPLLVRDYVDEGTVECKTMDIDQLFISRYHITTPVVVCDMCAQPMFVRTVKGGHEKIECPNHNQHQADVFVADAMNVKKNNRSARRRFKHRAIGLQKKQDKRK